MRGKKIVGWLSRISPEAVGRAARFACRVAIKLPDEQREEPCAARSQEVERSLEGCGIAAGGWENGRLDNFFFAWGGSNMCHPPVLVIEAFNDGAKQ